MRILTTITAAALLSVLTACHNHSHDDSAALGAVSSGACCGTDGCCKDATPGAVSGGCGSSCGSAAVSECSEMEMTTAPGAVSESSCATECSSSTEKMSTGCPFSSQS